MRGFAGCSDGISAKTPEASDRIPDERPGMHLKKTKRNGRVYLSVVQNYREGNATKTRTIETIGYADAYESEFADPIAHFDAYVAELNEQRRAKRAPIEFSFPRDCVIDADCTESARWGISIALAYLDALEAKRAITPGDSTCANRKEAHREVAAARRAFEVFAAERVLHASPKHETWERRASFPRRCDFAIDEAYRALSVIAAADGRIARAMRAAYERIRPDHAPLSCARVVLGTFAFNDVDDVDSAQNRHPSARHAVCLAMVLDEDGMPAGYRLIDANPDAAAVRNLARDVKESLGAQRIVLVAGRLSHADAIMRTLAASGDGFIMHRPLETAVEGMRHWVVDERGYTTSRSGNYRIKSRVRSATFEADDGNDDEQPAEAKRTRHKAAARRLRVRDIVFWGRDYALRKRGGKSDAAGDDLDGYACIVTSETDLAAPEVFHSYRELWRLAEPFQVLESDFSPSPYPTPGDEHLRAHFALCYAAFFALRLERRDLGWRYNAAQVADALGRMQGSRLAENWFLFGYRSDVSDAIEQAAGVETARRLRTRQDIRRGIAQARKHIRGEGPAHA